MLTWWKDLKIGTKLMTSFMAVVVLTIVVSVVGFQTEAKLGELGDQAITHAFGLRDVMDAQMQVLKTSRAVRNAILDSSEEDVRKRIDDVQKYDAEFQASFASYQKSIALPATKEKAAKALALYDQMRAAQDQMMQLALEQRDAEAIEKRSGARQLANDFETTVEELVASKVDLMKQSDAEQQKASAAARVLTVVLAVLASVLAVMLGIGISRSIADALHKTMQTAEKAADGDLTVRVPVTGKDEFGRTADALNQFLTNLHDSMSQVAQSSESVSSSSRELSSSAQNISSGAQEQASSLEETAASLEEMTSTVKQNADNAQQAAQLAHGARDVAEKGGKVVGSAVDAMKEINAASRKIADIITAIDEIAFQTNLLALNAAVEAARAGEQGRGFAVVAGEVRNLAQRSASAAKEIKALIQDSVEKVEYGSKLVDQSGQTLEEIVVSVKKVTEIIAEIAAASREQSTGIDQVNTAVTQMDQVTQSNASQTEELAGTAEALAAQANQMRGMVEKFKLESTRRGTGASFASSAPAATQPKLRAVAGRAPARAKSAPRPAAGSTAVKTGTHDGFEEF